MGSTSFNRLAIADDAILYDIFKSDIGRQFSILFLAFKLLGIRVIIPCFCVIHLLVCRLLSAEYKLVFSSAFYVNLDSTF